jgi:predicted nuclease of predicted toxin-antitoxin system
LRKNAADALREAGYDISTVQEQKLSGIEDRLLIDICSQEMRCLVTMDMEFSNPILFRPTDYAGIIVLRLPSKPNSQDLLDIVRTLVNGLSEETEIAGKLWIVQRGRIREYQPQE